MFWAAHRVMRRSTAATAHTQPLSFERTPQSQRTSMANPGWDDALAGLAAVSSGESDGGQWAGAADATPDCDSDSCGEAPPDLSGWQSAVDAVPSPSSGGTAAEGSAPEHGQDVKDPGSLVAHDSGAALALPACFAAATTVERLDMLARFSRRVPDEEINNAVARVAEFYVAKKFHLGSTVAEAESLGTNDKLLRRQRLLCAACVFELDKVRWQSIGRCLSQPHQHGRDIRLVAYFEFATYDGVDLTLRVTARPQADGSAHAVLNRENPEELIQQALACELGVDTADQEPNTGPAKLLNAEVFTVLVVEHQGRRILLHGEAAAHLQVVDRNTAGNLKAAVERLRMASESSEAFQRRIRIAMTDAAAYKTKCERHIMEGRSSACTHIHLYCDVHVLAGIHRRVYDVVDGTISGMIAVALSVSHAGQVSMLRMSLRKVLAARLRLVYCEASASAAVYRDNMLNLFLGRSAETAKVRAAITRCASGDWRKGDCFEYFAQPEETVEQAMQVFAPSVLGHAPAAFPRHRWAGASSSMRDFGLLTCIHGLLPPVYRDFVASNFGNLVASRPAEEQSDYAGQDGARSSAHASGQALGYATATQTEVPQDWSAANRAHRGSSLQWLSGDLALEVVVAAKVLQPMHTLMTEQLRLAGGHCATVATAKLCDDLTPGASLLEGLSTAELPLLVAARGHLDKRCMDDLASAQDDREGMSAWPPHWATLRVQHLLFRLFSRQGAALHERVVRKHKGFPFRLFRLLVDPEARQDIESACRQSQDPFTAEFTQRYSDDLMPDDAQAELLAISIFSRPSTVRLESLNASIRRRLLAVSTQVTRPHLANLSADVLLGKTRVRHLERALPAAFEEETTRRRRSLACICPHTARWPRPHHLVQRVGCRVPVAQSSGDGALQSVGLRRQRRPQGWWSSIRAPRTSSARRRQLPRGASSRPPWARSISDGACRFGVASQTVFGGGLAARAGEFEHRCASVQASEAAAYRGFSGATCRVGQVERGAPPEQDRPRNAPACTPHTGLGNSIRQRGLGLRQVHRSDGLGGAALARSARDEGVRRGLRSVVAGVVAFARRAPA